MKHQPNRLPADARHGFGGSAIDRSRPLSFRLNGRAYEAFAGDTVLSALLAAGVEGAGIHHGSIIALGERFAPPVAPARTASDPAKAMPMDRVPVADGLELVTLGPRGDAGRFGAAVARLLGRFAPRIRALGHRLDDPRAFDGPWLQATPAETVDTDTLVVGGGVAGMSAAVAAAEAGDRVVLVERQPALGGDASFFGPVGEEETPEDAIARLSARIAGTDSITVITNTDAFGIAGMHVLAHRIEAPDGEPRGRVLELIAKRIVLATGTSERLPVFAGNRLPGITGALTAFHRATRYGLWPAGRTLVSTPHNFSYRLALHASDAGVAVQRVVDSRIAPQSRFIDFCKASGITLAAGMVPRLAERAGREEALQVAFSVAIEGVGHAPVPIVTDFFVAAGTWQPRLALWLMAGGHCRYEPSRRWLAPAGAVENVVLAGSAAGYRNNTACVLSGERAVALLLGLDAPAIDDTGIEAIYESPDDAPPVAPWRQSRAGTFLDAGGTFTLRPHPHSGAAQHPLPDQLHTMSIADVAASVELGLIAAEDAGSVAAERCLAGGDIIDTGWRVPADGEPRAPGITAYLAGRFGHAPKLVALTASDGRVFETGCLVYPSSDAKDPFAAIGAIVGRARDGAPGGMAAIDSAALASAPALFVRDTSGPVAVRLEETSAATAESAARATA